MVCRDYVYDGRVQVFDGSEPVWEGVSRTLLAELPWRTEGQIQEVWHYDTDIMTAWDGSQTRMSLREVPRRSFSATYLLNNDQIRQLRGMLRNDQALATGWKFPLWHDQFQITDTGIRGVLFQRSNDDSASAADPVETDFNTAFSFSGWVRPRSVPGSSETYYIMAKWLQAGDQRAYWFGYREDGAGNHEFQISLSGDGINEHTSRHRLNGPLATTEWVHVAFVYDGSKGTPADRVVMYLNGEVVTQTATGGTLPAALHNSSGAFYLGDINTTPSSWDGDMAEVRLWAAALTQTEIQTEMNATTVQRTASLAIDWSLTSDFVSGTGGPTLTGNGSPRFRHAILGNFTNADLYFEQYVLLTNNSEDEDDLYEWLQVSAVSDAELEILDTQIQYIYDTFRATIHPAVQVYPTSGDGYERRAINLTSVSLSLEHVDEGLPAGGTGATVNTYQSKPLLEPRPWLQGGQVERFDGGTRDFDPGPAYGGGPLRESGFSVADIPQGRRFVSLDYAERQYWRKFFDTVKGRRGSFYAPTWRDDLPVHEQPAGGSTYIDVVNCPDFDARWYSGGSAHQDIQLETDAGVLQRRVTSVIDNGDGSIRLNLDSALPGGLTQVDVVSFLELSTLGSDDIRWTHQSTYSIVEFTTRVVEQ